MTKGNLILLKGSRNVGKTGVAVSVIRQFLSENPNAKAVYVGMNAKGKEVQEKIASDRLMCIGVTDDLSASSYLAPQVALRAVAQTKDCLFVFDDVLAHQNKERSLFDLADQPFSPINILNEVAENTGTFRNERQVTSIIIADCNGGQLIHQQDEDKII